MSQSSCIYSTCLWLIKIISVSGACGWARRNLQALWVGRCEIWDRKATVGHHTNVAQEATSFRSSGSPSVDVLCSLLRKETGPWNLPNSFFAQLPCLRLEVVEVGLSFGTCSVPCEMCLCVGCYNLEFLFLTEYGKSRSRFMDAGAMTLWLQNRLSISKRKITTAWIFVLFCFGRWIFPVKSFLG